MSDLSWDDLRVAVPDPGQYAYRQLEPAERDSLGQAWLRDIPEESLTAAAIDRVEANLGKIEEAVDHWPNCRACVAAVSQHSVRAVLDALNGGHE